MRRVEAAKFEFIPILLFLSVTLLTRTSWLYVTLEAWTLLIRASTVCAIDRHRTDHEHDNL